MSKFKSLFLIYLLIVTRINSATSPTTNTTGSTSISNSTSTKNTTTGNSTSSNSSNNTNTNDSSNNNNNSANYNTIDSNASCTLTQQPPSKAYPSLIKCYRNNVNACCVSAHDDQITRVMLNFLPNSCQRKFSEMEQYFCYGCHYTEPTSTYVNENQKIIYICYDYAVRLWGGDLTQPTTQYDECGADSYWDVNS